MTAVDTETEHAEPGGQATQAPALWQRVALWVLGAVILAVYMGLWRPLWYDEILHFAFGPMTFADALRTVDYTTIEVNHGQTGVYMLTDWALLQVFGANAVALRLPSLLFGVLLLASAVIFIRRRGLGFWWQALALIVLAAHPFLMGFTADARPYMPLAGASLAVLAYYQYPVDQRRRFVPVALGILGVVGGVLFHPFIVYILVLAVPFSIWLAWFDGRLTWRWRDVIRYANPWLLGSGALLFLVIGELTWLRRVAEFGYGPFDMMGDAVSASRTFVQEHVFRGDANGVAAAVLLVVTLGALAVTRFRGARDLIPPTVLLAVGLTSSVTVSALSAYRTYWILDRQWVAGIAIASLALAWLFGEMARLAVTQRHNLLWFPVGAFLALTSWALISSVSQQFDVIQQWREASATFQEEARTAEEIWAVQSDDEGTIYLANVNVARGGPVYGQMVEWYVRQAGMRPEFRENPSWTGFLGPSEIFGPNAS